MTEPAAQASVFDLSVPRQSRARERNGRWLIAIHERLLQRYGPQNWWPADTPFEVMVGAVLTQNTNWRNVERAIDALNVARLLEPAALATAPPTRVADLIRPAGYFNVKTRRLQALAGFVESAGGVEGLSERETDELRRVLLAVHGIGPETADDILLYAFARPVFVIDAYTKRLMSRLTDSLPPKDYEAWRAFFEGHLPGDAGLFNEFHALVVRHAKEHCAVRPRCEGCPVLAHCRTGRQGQVPGRRPLAGNA